MIITIDGIDYETDNKQLAQAVTKLQSSKDAEENTFKEKLKEKDEEMEKVEKEKDEAEAKAEVASKDSLSDDALNSLVATRAKLLTEATAVIGDKMPECGCPNKVMAAVVDHIFPDISLDGKSVDYVTATYDMAIAKSKKSVDSLENLQKDFSKDGKTPEITRDSARDNYMVETGFTVEGK